MKNIKHTQGDSYTTESLALETDHGSAILLIGLTSPELQIDGFENSAYQYQKTAAGLIGVGPMYKDSPDIYGANGELLENFMWLAELIDAGDRWRPKTPPADHTQIDG